MTLPTIPAYVNESIAPSERGLSFGISFDDYRWLAGTSLAVTDNLPMAEIGIYKRDSDSGVAVDIWAANYLLTIEVNSVLGTIALFSTNLDSVEEPVCLLSLSSTEENWKHLGQVARKELEV